MNDENIMINRETNDYEYINGELFLKSKSVVKAIKGMLNFEDYEPLLKEGLGISKHDGSRI